LNVINNALKGELDERYLSLWEKFLM
jgi:hypothetical protein